MLDMLRPLQCCLVGTLLLVPIDSLEAMQRRYALTPPALLTIGRFWHQTLPEPGPLTQTLALEMGAAPQFRIEKADKARIRARWFQHVPLTLTERFLAAVTQANRAELSGKIDREWGPGTSRSSGPKPKSRRSGPGLGVPVQPKDTRKWGGQYPFLRTGKGKVRGKGNNARLQKEARLADALPLLNPASHKPASLGSVLIARIVDLPRHVTFSDRLDLALACAGPTAAGYHN